SKSSQPVMSVLLDPDIRVQRMDQNEFSISIGGAGCKGLSCTKQLLNRFSEANLLWFAVWRRCPVRYWLYTQGERALLGGRSFPGFIVCRQGQINLEKCQCRFSTEINDKGAIQQMDSKHKPNSKFLADPRMPVPP